MDRLDHEFRWIMSNDLSSFGYTQSSLKHTNTNFSTSSDPTLSHFSKICIFLPILPPTNKKSSIIWRCNYCKFEINHDTFNALQARTHLANCYDKNTDSFIDQSISEFFQREIDSLEFASNLTLTPPAVLSTSITNSIHSISSPFFPQ